MEKNEIGAQKMKAVLCAIYKQNQENECTVSLGELEKLCETAGCECVAIVTQCRETPDVRTVLGKGKMTELSQLCETLGAELVVFDGELSPSQIKSIEDDISSEVSVIDRSMLILDIFADHARTSEGRLQVELAQLKYTSPRLVGRGKELSRQGGAASSGSVGARGPGETKLEIDRRRIKEKIASLEEELKKVEQNRMVMRRQRDKSGIVKCGIVGYTNAGKSTLLNYLTGAGILAENKLFATLDTTVRKVIIDNLPFLLTDTVGFIRKLPTHLVESFKSTLDEVRDADLLVHVVDISHPSFEEQIEIVNQTLHEVCNSSDKPMIIVFNKIDAFSYVEKDPDDLSPKTKKNISLDELKETWMARMNENCIFISAKEKNNIEELKKLLYERVKEIHVTRFPYNDFLFQKYDEEENI